MGIFSKFFTVGGATLISRFLGFAREMLIASILGAGPVADAFYAAFRFPNLFRRLFAEGAFNSAFVPMFGKEMETGDRRSVREFAENVMSYLVLVLLILTAIAEISMPWLVGTIIVPKFTQDPEKFALTVELTRIMFPFLLCMSLVAMLSGILNTLRHFFVAAIAPAILNVVLVSILLLSVSNSFDPVQVGYWLAWGVAGAGFLQLALLYYSAAKIGFALRLKIPRASPNVKKLLMLAAPVALTGGITQINLMVGQIIASAQNGAIAILNYADRIYQLPLGVVGIAIGVVLLPELTRALASNKTQEVQTLQNKSLEFAILWTLPASVGLFFIPGPVIAVLYERGAFTSETTALTAAALAAFAIGLPSFVLQKVFQPVYFARFNMRAPMWFALVSAITNIIVSLLLFPSFGHVGIAIATSVAGWANALLLVAGLARNRHFMVTRSTLIRLLKIAIASLAMGGALFISINWLNLHLQQSGFLTRLGLVSLTIGLGGIVYFGTLIISGGLNLRDLRSSFSRK